MEQLVLQTPTLAHKQEAEAFKQEFFDHNEPIINGSALLDQMEYEPWLAHAIQYSRPETVGEDWVVSTTLFAVRLLDNKIVGMVDIRHNIEHPFLAQYGGHIGYAVRPTERRKGYATEILKQALAYAHSIGLNKVMLGCYSDNVASIKTITACGGQLIERKPYADGKPMELYWINC